MVFLYNFTIYAFSCSCPTTLIAQRTGYPTPNQIIPAMNGHVCVITFLHKRRKKIRCFSNIYIYNLSFDVNIFIYWKNSTTFCEYLRKYFQWGRRRIYENALVHGLPPSQTNTNIKAITECGSSKQWSLKGPDWRHVPYFFRSFFFLVKYFFFSS